MRIPQSPPTFDELVKEVVDSHRFERVLRAVTQPETTRHYHHWDKLRHLPLRTELNHHEWWLSLKLKRAPLAKQIPLRSTQGTPFHYNVADPIQERLHEIDLRGGGAIAIQEAITNPDIRNRYLVTSLIEEAITSSQLEGAATTRDVARKMIRTNRQPRDRSEQMILNNFRTMQEIRKLKDEKFSTELIFSLHSLVTRNTLDDPEMAGRFRPAERDIRVENNEGQVVHIPPAAEELQGRMEALCDFANARAQKPFAHPVIRSIILHFWLAYDHPFVDGNGRTARALFYWSMLQHGFWVLEFISISEIILKAPSKYVRAFLYTETDDNDLTYFIFYHLNIIRRAFDKLHQYIEKKTRDLGRLEQELRGMSALNHRQKALVGHALRHPYADYTFESHRTSHGIVYETARTDLLSLAKQELLRSHKVGRTWHFSPPSDLEERLRRAPK